MVSVFGRTDPGKPHSTTYKTPEGGFDLVAALSDLSGVLNGYAERESAMFSYGQDARFTDGTTGRLYFRNEAAAKALLGDGGQIARPGTNDEEIRKKRGSTGDIFTTPLGQLGSRTAANVLLG